MLFQGYVEKLQIELQRCQENYLDAIDKGSTLEEELKQAKEKLKLFDHNDLGKFGICLLKFVNLTL